MKELIYSTKPNMNVVPGGWAPEKQFKIYNLNTDKKVTRINNGLIYVDNVLTARQCGSLVKFFDGAGVSESVSIQGMVDWEHSNSMGARLGSVRTTGWVPKTSLSLWKIFHDMGLFGIRTFDDYAPTDWWQHGEHRNWKPICFSPMFRYMRYQKGGQHFAHYDASYMYPDTNYRTLMSFVLYLTTNSTGATRFVEDGQKDVKVWDRKHDDWDRPVRDEEVIRRFLPKIGSMLFFDHRMCHDVEEYDGKEGDRIIIRGDVIYEAI